MDAASMRAVISRNCSCRPLISIDGSGAAREVSDAARGASGGVRGGSGAACAASAAPCERQPSGQGANTLSGSAGRAGATVRRISGSGRNGACSGDSLITGAVARWASRCQDRALSRALSTARS